MEEQELTAVPQSNMLSDAGKQPIKEDNNQIRDEDNISNLEIVEDYGP